MNQTIILRGNIEKVFYAGPKFSAGRLRGTGPLRRMALGFSGSFMGCPMWSDMTRGKLVVRCCQTGPALHLTAMKAAGVWLVTIYKLWIKTSLKSGPGSSTQTGICRRRGTGPEIAVRKCTFGNRDIG